MQQGKFHFKDKSYILRRQMLKYIRLYPNSPFLDQKEAQREFITKKFLLSPHLPYMLTAGLCRVSAASAQYLGSAGKHLDGKTTLMLWWLPSQHALSSTSAWR